MLFWHASFYGDSYFEAYYGNQTENEKIRIDYPKEDIPGYIKKGPIRYQIIIPVIDGDKFVLGGRWKRTTLFVFSTLTSH